MNRYALKPGVDNGRNHERRTPLRSIRELADEFGVTLQVLSSLLAKDPAAPLAELDHTQHGARSRYFKAEPVRAWWKARKIG